MASIEEAIRRLIYRYVVEGADKVVQTQAAVAASTEKTDKASLSLEKSFNSLERRYVSTVRNQQEYQKVQERVNAAVAQNPALQERANAVLAAASQKYTEATGAQKAFAAATSGVSAQLTAMAAGAGPVGTFLSALGPWGMAAAVGLGAVTAVFDRIDEGAKRVGEKSTELMKFSNVTGLTVTEIKGLTRAGQDLGITSDEITTAVERLSVGLDEAHKGTGDLYDKVREINPALAQQLAGAKGTAEAWDIMAKAINGATDAAQRNALARAAFGRGGIEVSLAAMATDAAGGIEAMGEKIATTTGLTQQWTEETKRLYNENLALQKAITGAMDAAFALPALERQNSYLKINKAIVDTFREMRDYANSLVTPTQLSQRGPSEGAMQAQQEAKAQRMTPEEANNLTAQIANDSQKRIALLGREATEQDRINAKTYELKKALDANLITQQEFDTALGNVADNGSKATDSAKALAQYLGTGATSAKELNETSKGLPTFYTDAGNASEQLGAALARGARFADSQAASMKQVADQAQRAMQYIPGIAKALGGQLYDVPGGGKSQFDPAGYTSSFDPAHIQILSTQRYGAGGFDPRTGAPNAQGLEYEFSRSGGTVASGSLMTTRPIGQPLTEPFTASLNTTTLGLRTRAIDVLSKEQQVAPLTQLIQDLKGTPYSLEREEAVKSLTEKLDQLAQATAENTSATQTQTDVLSPFYSSDPRKTHLGFRAFAGGGIMSQYGELPLMRYAGGGMATRPQVAIFGEGSTPEAYVPVPNGRIPVEMRMPANTNNKSIRVTINVMGNANAGTVAALRQTAFQQAQAMRRMTG